MIRAASLALILTAAPFLVIPVLAAEVAEDCAMREGDVIASAPQDVGNGRLMVRITQGAGHALMLVDCRAGEAAVGIGGATAPDPSAAPFFIGPDREVAGMVADLKDARMTGRQFTHTDLVAQFPLNETPFCGCTIFYPDSPGAEGDNP